ncbi:AAEL004736-PA [Aedes aegypti]|uniref:AAEL004736-PA n=1 Tax=Aedes aegypti TaxID=7159 RepID=Q17C50_AEDAE|nr:AAEL004736-PA [Aedes aegypti]
MADCQFVGLGFLKNGKIDLKNFRNTTANELGANEPEAQDTISRLAEMCVRIVREQATAIVNAGTKCNATAFIFLKCMGDGVFSNCPDKYWSTSEKEYDLVTVHLLKCFILQGKFAPNTIKELPIVRRNKL